MTSEFSKKDLSQLVKSKITAAILEINHVIGSSKNLQKAIKKGVKLITAELHKNWKDEIKTPVEAEYTPEPVKKAKVARKTAAKAGVAKSAIKKTKTAKKAVKKASVAKKAAKKKRVAKKAIKKATPSEKTITNTKTANPS